MLLIRSRHRHVGAAEWCDGGVVGLTVAAIGAALIFPAILAINNGRFVEDAVNLSYPLGDFTLPVFVAVAFSLSDWRPGRLWLWLGAGIIVSALADVVYVHQAAKGTYAAGTFLDTMWPASMSLFAVAAWQPVKRHAEHAGATSHTIVVTLASTVVACALLMIAGFRTVTPLAVGLAGGAVLLGAARAGLTYVENLRMLRRSAHQALTDGLTGLGNRRRLMDDLEAAVKDADHGHASTLVFFDLNGVKRYNDSVGHAAGDSLLARVGAALNVALEGRGQAYRLGGDEFCVLVGGAVARHDRLIGSTAAAHRARQRVHRRRLGRRGDRARRRVERERGAAARRLTDVCREGEIRRRNPRQDT